MIFTIFASLERGTPECRMKPTAIGLPSPYKLRNSQWGPSGAYEAFATAANGQPVGAFNKVVVDCLFF